MVVKDKKLNIDSSGCNELGKALVLFGANTEWHEANNEYNGICEIEFKDISNIGVSFRNSKLDNLDLIESDIGVLALDTCIVDSENLITTHIKNTYTS